MFKSVQIICLGLVVIAAPVVFGSTTIVCPKEISVSESLVGQQEGYQSHVEQSGHFWAGVSVFSGARKDNAELAPSSTTSTADTYELEKAGLMSLQCNYQNSGLSLVKTITAKRCVVEKDESRMGSYGALPTLVRCE